MMETSTTMDRGDECLTKDPIYQPQRTLKVVVIGAGASGLLLAYKLQRHFKDLDLKVFEKNPAVSGTWFENVGVYFLSMRTHNNTGISHLLIRCRHTQDVPVTCLPTVSLTARASLSCILCSSLGHSLYVVVRAKNGLVRQLRWCVRDSPILHRLLHSSWSTEIHRTGAPSAQCGMVGGRCSMEDQR